VEGTVQHRLSNKDQDRRRGDCARCGPGVPIKLVRPSAGNPYWRCRRANRGPGYSEAKRRCAVKARLAERGLTPQEHAELLAQQDGRCAICRQAAKLDLDHCHATGRTRGLLCRRCNLGLGHFEDDGLSPPRRGHPPYLAD
jgi:hypothetical protein